MPSGAGLLADWQSAFGTEFHLVMPFLKPTARQARSYPCPSQPPCECRHVVRETDWGLMAICTCGPGECDATRIEPKDLMVYALDRAELGSAICHALGFAQVGGAAYSTLGLQEIGSYGDSGNTLKRELQTSGIHEIGSYGDSASPVYLAFARHGALLIELEKLFATRPAPFVLLTPTLTAYNAQTNSALQRHGSAQVALSAVLESPIRPISPISPTTPSDQFRQLLAPFRKRLTEQRESAGVLQKIHRAIAAVQKQFRQLPGAAPTPPIPEDVARSAFALVQQLDSESRMKAPTVLTVFRLYCIEELSAERIAKKHHCSKPTILRRLELIRAKTGMDPAAFRTMSTHLSKLEDETRDSRAAHIHRKNLIYDDDGEDHD